MIEAEQVRTSYKALAYAHIKKKIVHGDLRPGDIIKEKDFIAALGISRTPVREALSQLSDEGMIDIMPSRGMVVSHISISDVLAMYDTRQLIEPHIARQAAGKASAETLRLFREQFSNTAPISGPEKEEDMDSDFHLYLAACIGNRYLLRLEEMLMSQSERIRVLSSHDRADRESEARQEHLCIIDALLENDGERAAAAALLHLKKSIEGYRSIIAGSSLFSI